MQNKYRKMYNENLLGTSDVSILKFYYASFKIQYQKGKVADVDTFLDEAIKVAADTSRTFKIFGFIPYFSSKYSTEQQRISKFISLRRNDIAALFLKDDITDKEAKNQLHISHIKIAYHTGNRHKSNSRNRITEHPDGYDIPRS